MIREFDITLPDGTKATAGDLADLTVIAGQNGAGK
jgi:DNA repair exonuclease SbcCD ATPase subunit